MRTWSPGLESLRRLATDLAAAVVDRVLPRICLGCARPVSDRRSPLLLCAPCRSRLELVDAARACSGCLRPLAPARAPAHRCGACRESPPAFESVRALWRYRPPLDGVLRAFKFGGLDFLGDALASAAAERFGSEIGIDFDRVVPIPLPWTRRIVRGYNQAERIGRPLARLLGLEFSESLARTGRPRAQSGLDREARRANAVGSFRVAHPGRVRGARILLVDDILTTGATVRAAAAELERAGACRIAVLVAAWTPPEPAPGLLDSPCTRS